MPTGDKPNVPRAYHNYIIFRDRQGNRRTLFLWSYDQAAWTFPEAIAPTFLLMGITIKAHKWRAPAPAVDTPRPVDLDITGDMPF